MRFESPQAGLSNDIVPIDMDVNTDYIWYGQSELVKGRDQRLTLYERRKIGTVERVEIVRGEFVHPITTEQRVIKEQADL